MVCIVIKEPSVTRLNLFIELVYYFFELIRFGDFGFLFGFYFDLLFIEIADHQVLFVLIEKISISFDPCSLLMEP